ncbi:MAG: oxidoreductase of aldo/keto reductase family, subgroup 1, partial [uncultured Friedmanniella sp.]
GRYGDPYERRQLRPAGRLPRTGVHAPAGLRDLADQRRRRHRGGRHRAGDGLPAPRHRHRLRQRGRHRPRSRRGRPAPRAGVRHHQAAAGPRRPRAADDRGEPDQARARPRRPVAGALATRRPGRARGLAGGRASPAGRPGHQRRRQQLLAGPDRRDHLRCRGGSRGEPDQVGPAALRRDRGGRAPRARGGARGLQPAQGDGPRRPGAGRHRRRARGDAGPGRHRLARGPRVRRHPQVLTAGAHRRQRRGGPGPADGGAGGGRRRPRPRL